MDNYFDQQIKQKEAQLQQILQKMELLFGKYVPVEKDIFTRGIEIQKHIIEVEEKIANLEKTLQDTSQKLANILDEYNLLDPSEDNYLQKHNQLIQKRSELLQLQGIKEKELNSLKSILHTKTDQKNMLNKRVINIGNNFTKEEYEEYKKLYNNYSQTYKEQEKLKIEQKRASKSKSEFMFKDKPPKSNQNDSQPTITLNEEDYRNTDPTRTSKPKRHKITAVKDFVIKGAHNAKDLGIKAGKTIIDHRKQIIAGVAIIALAGLTVSSVVHGGPIIPLARVISSLWHPLHKVPGIGAMLGDRLHSINTWLLGNLNVTDLKYVEASGEWFVNGEVINQITMLENVLAHIGTIAAAVGAGYAIYVGGKKLYLKAVEKGYAQKIKDKLKQVLEKFKKKESEDKTQSLPSTPQLSSSTPEGSAGEIPSLETTSNLTTSPSNNLDKLSWILANSNEQQTTDLINAINNKAIGINDPLYEQLFINANNPEEIALLKQLAEEEYNRKFLEGGRHL